MKQKNTEVPVKTGIKIEIGIDCEPFTPRPNTYLPLVLKDTGIKIDPDKTTSRLFGAWTWKTTIHKSKWTPELYEKIHNRLKQLFENGAIRGAMLHPRPEE